MTYLRLRDIKTPPYAYVLNKDEAIESCPSCEMPFSKLKQKLHVEILTVALDEPAGGQPLMADHWMIGDADFAQVLHQLAPGAFEQEPVSIGALIQAPASGDLLATTLHREAREQLRGFFCFQPKHEIELRADLSALFAGPNCGSCGRQSAELPIEVRPAFEPPPVSWPAAGLRHLYLEGFDYLFREDVAHQLAQRCGSMIFEELMPQTSGTGVP